MKRAVKLLAADGMVEIVSFDQIASFEIVDGICTAAPPASASSGHDLPPPQSVKRGSKRDNGDMRIPLILDIETADPDDILTLLFAACHPLVDLKLVTVTPGSADQVKVIKWILAELGVVGVRLGAREWPTNKDKKNCISMRFYAKILFVAGHTSASFDKTALDDDEVLPAGVAIATVSAAVAGGCTLFTGGPPTNLGSALEVGAVLDCWVAQGGFCGVGVVPAAVPTLAKFEGKVRCQTWNFGGAHQAVREALDSDCIGRRVFVGKNVCHKCVYTDVLHTALCLAVDKTADPKHSGALEWARALMTAYHSNGKGPKKLHDPLALATMINVHVCTVREVSVDQVKGAWGSVLCVGSCTWAATDYNEDLFMQTLLDCDPSLVAEAHAATSTTRCFARGEFGAVDWAVPTTQAAAMAGAAPAPEHCPERNRVPYT